MKPQVVIEVGSFVGFTTAHIALCLKNSSTSGKVYIVDISDYYLNIAMKNLSRNDLDEYVVPIKGESLDDRVLNLLPDEADIIFIDTAHTYPQTKNEIIAYKNRLEV